MKRFYVVLENGGNDWFLKGTTWTGLPTRADMFADETDARLALEKAAKLMKKSLDKKAQIKQLG